MNRYKITIEYDGTPYFGWQKQKNSPTVQEALETAILKFAQDKILVYGAGRTDSGVHAKGQVAHFDLSRDWKTFEVTNAINAHLRQASEKISILKTEQVSSDFHARFSAVKRHYVYIVGNRPSRYVLDQNRLWWVPFKLDVDCMQAAAKTLIGYHDFRTFRSIKCQAKNPFRTLERIDLKKLDDHVEFHLSARSFLHNQVRSIVGSLIEVGRGSWSQSDLKKALQSCDRSKCGVVAPAQGLYLKRVDYLI